MLMPGKCKLLTLEQRVDVLKKFDAGVSCCVIALELAQMLSKRLEQNANCWNSCRQSKHFAILGGWMPS